MTEIRQGTLGEYWKIIDFIDYVFSKNSSPHDFPKMYPNLYRQTEACMNNMLNLWEDGAIKASILAFPRTLDLNGTQLGVTGIGSVATHPRERGRGFMSQLMTANVARMREQGVHLSNLGGNRQRYNHFGYERSGYAIGAGISAASVRRVRPDFDGAGFGFAPMPYEDRETVEAAKALYETKPLHYVYDYDNFYLRMCNPGSGAVSVSRDGKFFGFASVSGKRMRELCIADEGEFADVMSAYALYSGDGAECKLGEWQLPLLRRFGAVGGDCSIQDNGMWLVLRWKDTLDAFVRFKSSYAALPDGELVVDVAGEGRFLIERGGVRETSRSADLELAPLEATRFFFMQTPEIFTFGLPAEKAVFARSMFPLPLVWQNAESV